jgi:hypothetical protein
MEREINYERLIELAEGRGMIRPTAREQRLLDTDPTLRAELEELIVLLAGLHEMPERWLDQAAETSILPAVREGIAGLRRGGAPAWLSGRNLWGNALAAAASLLLVLGIFFITGHFNGGISTPPALEDPDSLELAIDLSGGSMLYEAGAFGGIDLFSGSNAFSDSEAASAFLAQDTYGLMEEAENLDDESIVQLRELLGLDEM